MLECFHYSVFEGLLPSHYSLLPSFVEWLTLAMKNKFDNVATGVKKLNYFTYSHP